jgi:predicted acetyltransferase
MIVYADNLSKKDVKYIWKTCFPEDTDEFIDFYFNAKYKNENTLIYLLEGKAVACLQMLPYAMTFYGKHIPTAYISGAATLPQYQNKGIMKELLVYAFHEMKKRKIPLSTLIPQENWLIRFYEKLNYTPAFDYSEEKLSYKNQNNATKNYNTQISILTSKGLKEAYQFYTLQNSKRNLCIQKSFHDFKAIYTSFQLDNGNIFIALQNNTIQGLCFAIRQDSLISIKEMLCTDSTIEKIFLQEITLHYNCKHILRQKPANNHQNLFSKGMARILIPQTLLQLYAAAHPHISIIVSIHDKDIAQNKENYYINNGQCYSINPHQLPDNQSPYELDIRQLTKLLLGYPLEDSETIFKQFTRAHPYMSLMLE